MGEVQGVGKAPAGISPALARATNLTSLKLLG